MNMLLRMLTATPKNLSLPVIALLAGWYAGDKYGAPDFLVNMVDAAIAEGGEALSGLVSGGEENGDPAPEE